MAKNSIDAYGASGKTNQLLFNPDQLVLVVDKESPLYDERVHLPVNESLVLNIMHQGVIQPIVICKNPETGAVEVAAGRQRVKAAREANRRLTAKGCEPVQVPAVVRRAARPVDLAGVMVSENEIREADTPMGRAEKMRRLINFGKGEDELSVLFGCSTATVRATLALLDCTQAVRSAVESGEINVSHARALAKLEPEAQREKVRELSAVAKSTSGHQRARQQREIVGGPVSRMRTRREIEAAIAEASGVKLATLKWVLGAEDAR